ncbi:MAG: hypothetical protein PHE02_11560 [Lachnospiraceae bacterium]|nr:hypothetical protein [Lachnospiraceae bacterium]
MERRNDAKKRKEKKDDKSFNPELEREVEEKRLKSAKNDFNDVGGFPRAPLSGGIV